MIINRMKKTFIIFIFCEDELECWERCLAIVELIVRKYCSGFSSLTIFRKNCLLLEGNHVCPEEFNYLKISWKNYFMIEEVVIL